MSLKDRLQNKNKEGIPVLSEEQELGELVTRNFDEGYGALEDLLYDKSVDKIFVNKNKVYIEKKGKEYKSNITFSDPLELQNIIENISSDAGVKINRNKPYTSFKLKDGTRITVIMPPYALDFPILSIKKPKDIQGTLESLIGLDTISREVALVLEAIVNLNLNVLISGVENSGRTTLLGAIAKKIQNSKRILTIEKIPELKLNQDQVIRLYSDSDIDIEDLIIKGLELSPDKIILGDCVSSGKALLDVSINSKSFITTINANSAENALKNFQSMIELNSQNVNPDSVKRQILSNIDVVINLKRLEGGAIKLVDLSEISHEEEEPKLRKIFYWDYKNGIDGRFYSCGIEPEFIKNTGFEICDLIFEKDYEHTSSTPSENEENIQGQIQKLYSYSKSNIFKKIKKNEK